MDALVRRVAELEDVGKEQTEEIAALASKLRATRADADVMRRELEEQRTAHQQTATVAVAVKSERDKARRAVEEVSE